LAHDSLEESNDDKSQAEPSDNFSAPAKHRARRNSQHPAGSRLNPKQLAFYPLGWRAVLIWAKYEYRRWLALYFPFPRDNEALIGAKRALDKALAKHEEAGEFVEPGQFAFIHSLLNALIFI
jgi:hypothetical protein